MNIQTQERIALLEQFNPLNISGRGKQSKWVMYPLYWFFLVGLCMLFFFACKAAFFSDAGWNRTALFAAIVVGNGMRLGAMFAYSLLQHHNTRLLSTDFNFDPSLNDELIQLIHHFFRRTIVDIIGWIFVLVIFGLAIRTQLVESYLWWSYFPLPVLLMTVFLFWKSTVPVYLVWKNIRAVEMPK